MLNHIKQLPVVKIVTLSCPALCDSHKDPDLAPENYPWGFKNEEKATLFSFDNSDASFPHFGSVASSIFAIIFRYHFDLLGLSNSIRPLSVPYPFSQIYSCTQTQVGKIERIQYYY